MSLHLPDEVAAMPCQGQDICRVLCAILPHEASSTRVSSAPWFWTYPKLSSLTPQLGNTFPILCMKMIAPPPIQSQFNIHQLTQVIVEFSVIQNICSVSFKQICSRPG